MTSRRRSATIYTEQPVRKPHTAIIVGPARIIPAALRRLDIAWQWDHASKGFLVPRQHLADVEAMLTSDGHDVRPRAEVLL